MLRLSTSIKSLVVSVGMQTIQLFDVVDGRQASWHGGKWDFLPGCMLVLKHFESRLQFLLRTDLVGL